jgi:hypothetical protein
VRWDRLWPHGTPFGVVVAVSSRTRQLVYGTLPSLMPMFAGLPRYDGAADEGAGDPAAGSLDGSGPKARDSAAMPRVDDRLQGEICDLVGSPSFDAWTAALSSVGNCARPIRLHGGSITVDTTTGEVVSSCSSDDAPLGITYVRCGNRRASECPSCSRLYAADMFHLIRAGVSGGKTVPESVADNPLVFATFTAPSFGHVHGRPGHLTGSGASAAASTGMRCRPLTQGPARCRHGRSTTCRLVHGDEDPLLGQPLCGDCYDYASQVVWQWWEPDLWRRLTIALRRGVAHALGVPATGLAEVATVQYAKVAEYQRRGVVHFHALIRLDGPRSADGFQPASTGLGVEELADLVRSAGRAVRLPAPGVDTADPTRILAFGRQLDVRVVRHAGRTDDPDRILTPGQVAGYLAKYATKSAADTDGRASPDREHERRIRATVRRLASRAATAASGATLAGSVAGHDGDDPYELLGKWTHALGFRGHFASKSRRYSITLAALRRARHRAQILIADSRDSGRPLDLAALEADLLADDEDDTTLVIGHWTYAGAGWRTEAERVLALAAAARAREHAQWAATQFKHNHQSRQERQ